MKQSAGLYERAAGDRAALVQPRSTAAPRFSSDTDDMLAELSGLAQQPAPMSRCRSS
jgi:hypothetical protein